MRITNILETGRRESTYKLAVLVALMQHSVEEVGAARVQHRTVQRQVSICDIAERCVDLYWRQVQPFNGHQLSQTKGGPGKLLPAVRDLVAAAQRSNARSLATLRISHNDLVNRRIRTIARELASMPLLRLQNTTDHAGSKPFLYDDTVLRENIRTDELDAIGWQIQLFDGIIEHLAQLSPLLSPLITELWVSEVRRFNTAVTAPDGLEQHLFGTKRRSLATLKMPLFDLQKGQCFYCHRKVHPDEGHVDHVLPWSRTALDVIENLVLSDSGCNLNKSDVIPVAERVRSATSRGENLTSISTTFGWASNGTRVRHAAAGLLVFAPEGLRLWESRGHFVLLTRDNRATQLALLGAGGRPKVSAR